MQNFHNLKQIPTIEGDNPTIEAKCVTERFLDPHDDREDKNNTGLLFSSRLFLTITKKTTQHGQSDRKFKSCY